MAGRGLTAPDVVSALSEQNVEVAAGQVGQQPAVPGQQFKSACAVGRLSETIQFDNSSENELEWHVGPSERCGRAAN